MSLVDVRIIGAHVALWIFAGPSVQIESTNENGALLGHGSEETQRVAFCGTEFRMNSVESLKATT